MTRTCLSFCCFVTSPVNTLDMRWGALVPPLAATVFTTGKPWERRRREPPTQIEIVPTPATQAIYNQIREIEAPDFQPHFIQPHDDSSDLLHPCEERATYISPPSESYRSGSLLPTSPTDRNRITHNPDASPKASRRPRGRRAGPLKLDKRFRTAIKRKLGLICDQCKERR
jgi:hypothetical protein